MINTNQQIHNKSVRKAIQCQKKWREKEIIKFYATGRPIFNTSADIQRTTCHRNYLLNNVNDVHCMNCKQAWDQTFIILNLEQTLRIIILALLQTLQIH